MVFSKRNFYFLNKLGNGSRIPFPSLGTLGLRLKGYRHREPSGWALGLREAIPHSRNENRFHSITHEKGQLRNQPTGHASLAVTIRFYRHREPSGLALAMREAIPHSWNENRVHLITHEKGAAS